jgi:hypothetical protein
MEQEKKPLKGRRGVGLPTVRDDEGDPGIPLGEDSRLSGSGEEARGSVPGEKTERTIPA